MGRKAVFYVLLGGATVALSRLLGTWRTWRAAPTPEGSAWVAFFGLIVLGTMLALGFILYEVDRAAGRVRHRVGLYEWVIRSRPTRSWVIRSRRGRSLGMAASAARRRSAPVGDRHG